MKEKKPPPCWLKLAIPLFLHSIRHALNNKLPLSLSFFSVWLFSQRLSLATIKGFEMNKEPLSYKKFRDTNITQQFYTLLLLMICHQVMFQLGIVSRAIIPSTYIFGFVFIFHTITLWLSYNGQECELSFVNSIKIMN